MAADAADQGPVFAGSAPTNGQTMQLAIGGNRKLEFVWVEELQAWVGRRPVTHGEFHLFHPRHLGPEDDAGRPAGDQMPVANISFQDACNFADWVNARASSCLPSNAVVSLPRERDLNFLRCRSRPVDEDPSRAWLQCYGLHCPAVPPGPLLTIKDIPGGPGPGRGAGAAPAGRSAETIEAEPQMWEWALNRPEGLQVRQGPSLIQVLQDKARVKYSESTSIYPSLIGFRLVIRQ